jgi:ribosomal protein L13
MMTGAQSQAKVQRSQTGEYGQGSQQTPEDAFFNRQPTAKFKKN